MSAWPILRLMIGAVALGFAGCVSTPPPPIVVDQTLPPSQVDLATRNLRVFSAAWSLVADAHFDPKVQGVDWPAAAKKFGPEAAAATDKKSLYAAINRMLDLLNDSHTRALAPEQASERHTQVRARTGFNMTRLDGRWAVAEVVPGSPAEAAGVKRGWLVLGRNGRRMGERTDFRARDGEVATWEFVDERDQPVTLDLVARPLSTKPRQEARELPGGFWYLRFDGFDTADRRWLSEQLKAHRDAPGIVLDLRQNPGGDTLSLGISVGEFFESSVDWGTLISRSGRRSEKSSWQIGSARYAGRVAILVDRITASAAEIFSAALQDHGRATVIGRKTAGAVLASYFHRLPDGGELQLSHQDYVAPKGRRLEGNGLEPDVATQLTLADLRAGRDPDVEAALAGLRDAVASRASP
ncbi:MAG: peptidase S41 [Verrucomicrobia bacterium]|nr:peptidase S41 [Verrucomicrobiota bacterium]